MDDIADCVQDDTLDTVLFWYCIHVFIMFLSMVSMVSWLLNTMLWNLPFLAHKWQSGYMKNKLAWEHEEKKHQYF